MTLPYHVWYRLVRRRMVLAAEVPPSNESSRAWVGVYPLPEGGYGVRYFEVAKEIVDADYDISEEELMNSQEIDVQNEAQLEEVLIRWLDSLEELKVPALCDYPI